MKKLATLLLSSTVVNTFAIAPSFYVPGLKSNRDYQTIQCPTIADEFKPLITNLSRLKSKIKQEANCKPIYEQVSRYGDQVEQGREKYLKLTKDNKGKVLTAQDTTFIKNYAQNATEYAFSLLDVMSGRSSCFESDRENDGLQIASTLIHEVTSLASNVAGPYGAPISVVGNLVSGFFTGMHNISENRSGYKFEQPEQRQQYIENLCTYYTMQEELNSLLYPREHRENLETIAVAVNDHLSEISAECEGCNQLLSFLDQEEYVVNFGTEKSQSNLVNTIYRLEAEANDKGGNFIGSYIIDTYNNKKWLEDQISEFDRNSEEIVSNIGQDMLMDQKLDIESFLLERETPRFLKFQLDKSRDALSEVSYYYQTNLIYLIITTNHMLKLQEDPEYMPPYYMLPEYEFQDMVKGIKTLEGFIENDAVPYSERIMLESQYAKFINLYDSSYIAYGVFNTYCNFFKESKIYNSSIYSACENRRVEKLDEDLRSITPAARPYNFDNNDGNKGNRSAFTNWGESLVDTIEQLKATEF